MEHDTVSSCSQVDEEVGRIRLDYEPISDFDALNADVREFERLRQELDKEWEIESSKYCETIPYPSFDEDMPRRNYANPQGIVKDKSLFPYHDSCYALLDAYDGLYENFDQQPIPSDSKRPSLSSHSEYGWIEPPRTLAQRDDGSIGSNNDEETLVLCTLQSIMGVLFQKRRQRPNNHDSSVLVANTTLALRRIILEVAPIASISEGEDKELRPNLPKWPLTWDISDISPTAIPLPSDPIERADLLLRLLKHALSEWQRDHVLAGAILTKLATDKCFNHVPTLQKTLVVVATEYVSCDDFDCDHFVDHDCQAWKFFLSSLSAALRHGVDLVTDYHARTISAFTQYVYIREFGHLLKGKEKADQPTIALRRLQLKRSLVANRLEDEEGLETASDPQNQTPTRVLFAIIQAFGNRGEIELSYIRKNNQCTILPTEQLARHVDSYYNSLRILTSMAMSTCQILPNSERLYQISSLLVKSITACLLGFDGQVMDFSHKYEDSYYLASKFPELECVVKSPFRLADRVRKATQYTIEAPRFAPGQITSFCPGKITLSQEDLACNVQLAVQRALQGRPHETIREVVRNLFLRDAVYMTDSGLGYADFCVWCRFPVQPLDPVLSWHDCNHPMPSDLEDDDSDDDESTEDDEEAEWLKPINWAANEDGLVLGGELYSHFSFSLMAMFCSYHGEPWNPDNHHSFNIKFRQAAKSVVMSLARYNFPQEIVTNIISFLPRDGWPEDRKFCWNYECALKQMAAIQYDSNGVMKAPSYKLRSDDQQDSKSISISCKRCGIPTYCSKECRSHDWKEIHKRVCIEPPYHGKMKEHAIFCQSIADGSFNNTLMTAETHLPQIESLSIGDEADDEDESDWESVESDEFNAAVNEDADADASETNVTQAILNYIKHGKDRSLSTG